MAIPIFGSVTLSSIQTEFGGSNPISLSEYYQGTYVTPNNTNVPVSGIVSLSKFYGSVKQFVFTITTNYSTPQNLRSLAVAAGWNGSDNVLATIAQSVIISSNTTSAAALVIDGSFPNGVTLVNNGYIVGMGGRGGDTINNNSGVPAAAATAGGAAISAATPVSINNRNTIAGGGGGGGAGTYWVWNGVNRSCAGSGGGSGATQASGGTGEAGWSASYASVFTSSLGLYNIGGPSYNFVWGGRASSPGGTGGAWGTKGDGGGGPDGAYNQSGGAGGAGGAAVVGSNFVTWINTASRYGNLV